MPGDRPYGLSMSAAGITREARATCLRCRRPRSHCYCSLLPSLPSTTEVLFLQHPRERDVPIGTARIAHLSLPGSTLIEGVELDHHPAVVALEGRPDVAVLYPGEGARTAAEWAAAPPTTLVVLDGTWWQARKLILRNPRLAALPRLRLEPERPGTYRIRKEPSRFHLATVEAVALALGLLEGDSRRFATMLAPFNFMVERQLEAVPTPRSRQRRMRQPVTRLRELDPVVAAPGRAVIIATEANCHSREERAPGAPELLHVVAVRPHTGERFEAVLKPRRPLGGLVASRLGLTPLDFLDGEQVDDFAARWRAFAGSDPVWCSWGRYAYDLMAREVSAPPLGIDLRPLAARVLRRSAGGIERAAVRLGGSGPSAEPRRARRMLEQLEHILAELLRRRAAQALSDEGQAQSTRTGDRT